MMMMMNFSNRNSILFFCLVVIVLVIENVSNSKNSLQTIKQYYDILVYDNTEVNNNEQYGHASRITTTNVTSVTILEQNRINISEVFVMMNTKKVLPKNADQDGPVLDFAIIGFPKCGTTTMVANLGYIAPIPATDVCTPLSQTVHYAYYNWPEKYDPNNSKPLRGVKCPLFIDTFPPIQHWDTYLPKTKLIIGIRHPILWFQSFFNMHAKNRPLDSFDPYDRIYSCDPNSRPKKCRAGCPGMQLFCTERSKFHIALAKLGKTPLQDKSELQYLPSLNIFKNNSTQPRIRNPIFIYELGQLSSSASSSSSPSSNTIINDDATQSLESFWKDVADYLDYPNPIPHDIYKSSHGRYNVQNVTIDICDPQYDELRSIMMPAAYDMSHWICDYFVEIGIDVHVSNKEQFCNIVRSYKDDPCGRLIRLQTNGTYIVDPTLSNHDIITTTIQQQPKKKFTIQRTNLSNIYEEGSNGKKLIKDADRDGPILDFAIIGYPKCGTTTMVGNLANIAPMKIADVCTPIINTIWYSHNLWPKEYYDPKSDKPLRGVKCPGSIDIYPKPNEYSKYLPKTKLIIGIRHPVLWFQSFYNMQAGKYIRKTPYDFLSSCNQKKRRCRGVCHGKDLFCIERSKFHIPLAQLGKTPLQDPLELQYLQSSELGIFDSNNYNPNNTTTKKFPMIRNPVFIYEINQLSGRTNKTIYHREKFWNELATFLNYPAPIPHDKYVSSHGRYQKKNGTKKDRRINICDEKYDHLRSIMMPAAYEMSYWICDYFLEYGINVHVSDKEYFCSIIQSYKNDPCGRLIRLEPHGTYIVDPKISSKGANSTSLFSF